MKKGKEIKCCAHTKTDSMSTAVPAHLGRPTALSWLFLPSFVSTYCFFFFFLSDQIHIGGQPEQYATQCRTTGGRPLDGIRNLSAGLLTSRLPDGTAGPSLTSRAQQPLPWTPPGIIRPSTQRRVLIPQQYGWYLLRVLYASPVLPKSLLCAKGLF